ncbi:hypothetical protein NE235_30550 [Actinoallomurus spadix]|uniref:Uncharacterized protein n=1 Tax=Actinoallomurus spadix TaxID=79912 RepID=A0ABP3HM11_9ACTN|nr:hypothetical protein [Actinoallomurus spadix]MCO5990460.1 hypothetical protein [Actinoallomurus spadix]
MADPQRVDEYVGRLPAALTELGPRPVVRGAPRPEPDVEPFSPADEIDYAARRIAAVVAGRLQESADG